MTITSAKNASNPKPSTILLISEKTPIAHDPAMPPMEKSRQVKELRFFSWKVIDDQEDANQVQSAQVHPDYDHRKKKHDEY